VGTQQGQQVVAVRCGLAFFSFFYLLQVFSVLQQLQHTIFYVLSRLNALKLLNISGF
jgi:hypothetical protein